MKPRREIWKSIPDLPFYEASSIGRIRSLTRTELRNHRFGKTYITKKGKILTQTKNKKDYFFVSTFKDAKRKESAVHFLVATAFHGTRPNGLHCAHIDGNSMNNHYFNLKWCTQKENNSHKKQHMTQPMGEKMWNSKLTNQNILEIRNIFRDKIKFKKPFYSEIAKIYNVSRKCIENLVKIKSWKHLI